MGKQTALNPEKAQRFQGIGMIYIFPLQEYTDRPCNRSVGIFPKRETLQLRLALPVNA